MILPFVTPTESPIAGMLVQAAQQKRQREQQAIENMLAQQRNDMQWQRDEIFRQQAASQERRAAVSERREQRMYDKQQKMEAAQAIPQISKLLDPNSPEYNPALAQSIGQIHDIQFQQALPQLPPMPGAAPAAPQPGFVGPIDTPEHAAEAARGGLGGPKMIPTAGLAFGPGGEDAGPAPPMIQAEGLTFGAGGEEVGDAAMQEVFKQQEERDKFGADLASFPQRQKEHADQLAAYQQAKQQADMNPRYEGTSPLGPISFQPGATQQGMENRAGGIADRVQSFAATLKEKDPIRANRLEMLAGAAKARLVPEEKVMGILEKELQRESTEYMADQKNKTAITVAGMRKKTGGKGDGKKEDKVDLDMEKKIGNIAVETLNELGYKDAKKSSARFGQMAEVFAKAKDNAAMAAAGAGMWVKEAQGGTGVISNSDMQEFWKKIGGIPDKIENYITGALTGKLGSGVQKIVSDAVRDLGALARKRIEDMGGALEARLYDIGGNVPLVDRRIQSLLDTYVGGGYQRRTKPREAPAPAPEANPLLKAGKRSGLTGEDKAAVEWADAHPNDPRAATILKAHGL